MMKSILIKVKDEKDIKRIICLYKEGKSCVDIAALFNVSYSTIRNRLRQNNIAIRDRQHYGMAGKFHSEKTKKKISEAHKGMKYSKETIEKRSKSQRGKHRSKEFCINNSIKRRGSLNSRWKGGITLFNKQIRKTYEYRQWRSDVFTRDEFTCQECGDNSGGNLNAHHIKSLSILLHYYEITTLEKALKCEAIWNINNGITLCERCHNEVIHKKKHFKRRNLKCDSV